MKASHAQGVNSNQSIWNKSHFTYVELYCKWSRWQSYCLILFKIKLEAKWTTFKNLKSIQSAVSHENKLYYCLSDEQHSYSLNKPEQLDR